MDIILANMIYLYLYFITTMKHIFHIIKIQKQHIHQKQLKSILLYYYRDAPSNLTPTCTVKKLTIVK